jgi:hypothetical protein
MRYGPNTAEVTAFLAWLEATDASQVRVVLDNTPLKPTPERKAAVERNSATNLPGDVRTALDHDEAPAYRAISKLDPFANILEKNQFWTNVRIALKALANRGKLDSTDVDLILEPFRAAGFTVTSTDSERA